MNFYPAEDLRDGEIQLRLRETRETKPDKEELPVYYFDICLINGKKIGNCELRIGYNSRTLIVGNIGYGIYPPWRGHHYASKACVLLFRQAQKHNMEYLIITCEPSNIASLRTCELAGGKYIETVIIPEDNHECDKKRRVMVYRFEMKHIESISL